jgi:hypothetical protein
MSSRSLGKIFAEIAVLSWNEFYFQETTALFHYQENAPLRMRLQSCGSHGNIGAEIAVLSWKYFH